jgi:hypothetical protein
MAMLTLSLQWAIESHLVAARQASRSLLIALVARVGDAGATSFDHILEICGSHVGECSARASGGQHCCHVLASLGATDGIDRSDCVQLVNVLMRLRVCARECTVANTIVGALFDYWSKRAQHHVDTDSVSWGLRGDFTKSSRLQFGGRRMRLDEDFKAEVTSAKARQGRCVFPRHCNPYTWVCMLGI